jgi:SAM-dependent methyltransferase
MRQVASRIRTTLRGKPAASSAEYWTGFNVTLHHRFSTATESLHYFHWRNDQYPGYIELMPVAGQDGKVVLDYGCGPGHDLVGFAVYSRTKRLIAADVSPTSLAEAKARTALHDVPAEFLQIDEATNRLSLPDACVDYIHSSGVIHHIADPAKALRELKRVLVPWGRMRVMVYNYDSIWLHLYAGYLLRIKREAYPGLDVRQVFAKTTDGENCPIANVYKPLEFERVCKGAGLDCRYLGAAISLFELTLMPARFEAMMDRRLPEEHREFLRQLEADRQGYPTYQGTRAGIDGCYELTHLES